MARYRITESKLRGIIREAIRNTLRESVGSWNDGLFREELLAYLKADREYDGSAGAANARYRLLNAVLGDLPWEVDEAKFRHFLVMWIQGSQDLEGAVESCVDWVNNQLSQNKRPRVVW